MTEGGRTSGATFVVRGHVRYATGAPAASLLVRAYDKDMRREQFLDEATTGHDGSYRIPYTSRQFSRAEAATADLRISVCTAERRELASSPICFNAEADE